MAQMDISTLFGPDNFRLATGHPALAVVSPEIQNADSSNYQAVRLLALVARLLLFNLKYAGLILTPADYRPILKYRGADSPSWQLTVMYVRQPLHMLSWGSAC